MLKKNGFKRLYFILADDPDINESIAIDSKNIGGTEINTRTIRPSELTHDIDVWVVTKKQLTSLQFMQSDRNEKLFTVFIQRNRDGPITLFTKINPLIAKRKPVKVEQMMNAGTLQRASRLAKKFYVGTEHEQHNSVLKELAEEHDLNKGRFFVGKDRKIKKLLFFTTAKLRMLEFILSTELPENIKSDLRMYISTPKGIQLCNPDFSLKQDVQKS